MANTHKKSCAMIELRSTARGGDVEVLSIEDNLISAKRMMDDLVQKYLGFGNERFAQSKKGMMTYSDDQGVCRMNSHCFVSEESDGDIYCICLIPYTEGARDGILVCVEYDANEYPDDYDCQIIKGGRRSLANAWTIDHEAYSDLIRSRQYITKTTTFSLLIDSKNGDWFKHYYLVPGGDKEAVARIVEMLPDPDVLGVIIERLTE